LLFLVGKCYGNRQFLFQQSCPSTVCLLCISQAKQRLYSICSPSAIRLTPHTPFLALFSFLLHMVHLFTFFTLLAFLSLNFSFTFTLFLSSSYSFFILCS
jgi:hypothetical protein